MKTRYPWRLWCIYETESHFERWRFKSSFTTKENAKIRGKEIIGTIHPALDKIIRVGVSYQGKTMEWESKIVRFHIG